MYDLFNRIIRNLDRINNKCHILQRLQTALQDSIAHSVDLALHSCQKLFKWDPWNCPTADFLAKKSATLLDRESAFVQSITVAALIYTVTKNCSRGEIEGCGCSNYRQVRHFNDNDEWRTMRPDCSDQVDVSEQITRSLFEQTSKSRLDAQTYAVIHNNRAARLVSKQNIVQNCSIATKLMIIFLCLIGRTKCAA